MLLKNCAKYQDKLFCYDEAVGKAYLYYEVRCIELDECPVEVLKEFIDSKSSGREGDDE